MYSVSDILYSGSRRLLCVNGRAVQSGFQPTPCTVQHQSAYVLLCPCEGRAAPVRLQKTHRLISEKTGTVCLALPLSNSTVRQRASNFPTPSPSFRDIHVLERTCSRQVPVMLSHPSMCPVSEELLISKASVCLRFGTLVTQLSSHDTFR